MAEFRRQTSSGKKDGVSGMARALARKRGFARFVIIAERLAPRALPPIAVAFVFLSAAWFGLFRAVPPLVHAGLLLAFVLAFIAALVPVFRVRLPDTHEADRLLEERNALPHQAIGVQDDKPATGGAFGQALWLEHQSRMARMIGALETGLPRPDIARHDGFGLRALPVLLVAIAFAYSYSNRAGLISDAFRIPENIVAPPDVRIDAWVTPPAYTGRAPVFLTGRQDQPPAGTEPQGTEASLFRIPQFSDVTVRVTSAGTATDTTVTFLDKGATATTPIPPQKPEKAPVQEAAAGNAPPAPEAAANAPIDNSTHLYKITRDGTLTVGKETWQFAVIPDAVPDIAFDGTPRATVNAALEIPFLAKDDYGLSEAFAEIVPTEAAPAEATPLYPAPEYRLDLPRRNAKDAKATASRNLSEHPLAGKRVRITLVARDAAGQEGRSAPQEMILPARRFNQPLAGAVAEERQVMALNSKDLPRAIELNDALNIRPEDNIPNLTHFLLLQSAKGRMELARDDEMMRGTADYLWEVALGIEDGNLSLAERNLREAQQKLSDALERNASDEEIAKAMQELREAMKEFMQALAEQAMKNPQMAARPNMENMLSSKDLDKMMDQIENLAKSGSKDQARQMLSEMQRMMNNLQAGRTPQDMQQGQDNSEMRQQMDKLGQLMQEQQRLMEQTFKHDQALRNRMQMGDPLTDENLFEQQPGEQNQQQGQQQQEQQGGDPTGQMTEEQLRQALKDLQGQQQALEKQLGELQKGLEGMGIKPGKGFGQAGREMKGASGQLGEGQGEQAVGSQGRALQALREGAQDMMNQMSQGQGQGQGPGQGIPQYGQNGRDPLGRRQQNPGPDFGDQVKVPDEIDTQRAREILDEIRRRLGNNVSPEVERQYLERLLDIR
ncbi:TIGR02302 family protein [Rhizobiaceae bacterium CRRU44]|uniref:TIGR02302 family protein n=1 Tax=Ferranicluibacter rubi TaxID=2715133 RepID=A0AA43ZJL8_9HYPH|nr:TIGR02302 family protein [Ferranicluibacter rubi]NHT78143.1 TIGR02302 family protein [Ferranicluibacter rubi]